MEQLQDFALSALQAAAPVVLGMIVKWSFSAVKSALEGVGRLNPNIQRLLVTAIAAALSGAVSAFGYDLPYEVLAGGSAVAAMAIHAGDRSKKP